LQTDALRGTSYIQFSLAGRFLTGPKLESANSPTLVLKCIPGEHTVGHNLFTNGRYLASYLVVGAVLDAGVKGVVVQYRLDGGKLQTELWSQSTDFSAVFFSGDTLNILLYGHFLPHKENTSPAVRKLVIAAHEYLASEIVMQFDLPDPGPPSEACGLVVHKRSK